jgi:trigger factor
LKIEKNIRDDHQAELTVEVDPERMEAAKRRAARKLSERAKIPGFRPGKAPYDVIRRHLGEEAIVEQAMDLLVDDIYPQVLKEAEVEPAAMGMLIEKNENADPPKFIFRVPMLPTVELGDYMAIRLPYEWTAPGPEELDKSLNELRQMYGTTETVEREAQEGDYLLMNVKGEKANAEEGEDQSELSRENTATMVRAEDKQQENEWPYIGFARELIGLKPGESKTITHEYPQEFTDDKLQGATVTYETTVKTVRSVTLPEVNDEFAKMVSEKYENLDQLKEVLQKENEARSKSDYEDEYFSNIIDKIKENAVIKYPPQVLEHEGEHVLEELEQRISSQSMDLETYFKLRNTDKEKFTEEEVKPVAKKRLERGLILDEVARQQKIKIDEESLRAEFDQTISQLAYQGLDMEKLSKSGKKAQENFSTAIANESAARLLTRRTLERLKTIALGEYTESVASDDAPVSNDKPEEEAANAEVESKAEGSAVSPEVKEEAGEVTPAENEASAES